MKKFKNLSIENFQSHEKTVIDFDDNFTVIVGASDQGKSAIIRALKWVLFNEPQGDEFIRAGTSEVRVALTLEDGSVIIRERGRKNRYILRQGENEYVFESFGRGVPREILNAHGIKSVKLDENLSLRLSLSEQLDGPFLLSESKPTKAKTIGYLSGVNIIDKAIRDVSLEIRQKAAEERNKREDISRITEELKDFDDLKTLEELLPKVKTAFSEAERLKDKLEKIRVSADKLSKVESRIEQDKRIVDALKNFPEREIAKMDAVFRKYGNLSRSYIRLNEIQKRVSLSEAILRKTDWIGELSERTEDLAAVSRRLNSLKDCKVKLKGIDERTGNCEALLKALKACEQGSDRLGEARGIITRLTGLKVYFDKISLTDKKIRDAEEKLKKVQGEKEKHLADYGKLLKEIGRCPVCGSKIDDHTAEVIIGELR